MDWSTVQFVEPGWLTLAVAGPLLVAWLHRRARIERARQAALLISPRLQAEAFQSLSPGRRRLKQWLLGLSVACMALALARPQWGHLTEISRPVGEDLLVLLDCSQSMLAEDVRPSRLDRAKLGILDLVRTRLDGRVGLVAFAGQAFLQCPLTADKDAFRESLLAVDTSSIATAGTDLGRALEEASLAMESGAQRKSMVLVTDGEDLERSGVRVAHTLARQGVVVHTVGVGTPEGAEIRVIDGTGQPTVLRDGRGEIVRSRLDEKTLTSLAGVTGGTYRRFGPSGEGMIDLSGFLRDAHGRAPGLARGFGVERFHFPLVVATFGLLTESLIRTRRREPRRSVPRA